MFFEAERPKLLEHEVESPPHMVAHRSRDADSARWTLGLKSCHHIHRVTVQVGAIGNRVTDVDSDPESDGFIWGLVRVVERNLLLHLHRAAYCPVDAIEHDEKEIATSLDNPAAMLFYSRVYQVAAQSPQPVERANVIQSNEAAIANHVCIDDGDQLSPIWRTSDQV